MTHELRAPGPLDGIRVVGVEQAVAAPLCTRQLAELGADVIKVERRESGDFARGYDRDVHGLASHFVWLNHGKRSIELDLSGPEGRHVLARLVGTADVLVSNLAPGAIDRILDPRSLRAAHPGLVHCVIDGYGAGSPYGHRKAYDLLIQGEAGVTANTGEPGHPAKPGVSLADVGAGTYAVAAVLAALRERDRTGEGGRVDVALFDVVAEWMMPLLLSERYGGGAPPPAGTRHASIVPYGAFATADGQTINIAVQNEWQWAALCRDVLDLPELSTDERFAGNANRLEHREEVERRVAQRISTCTRDQLADALDAAGVPWGDLNDAADVVVHANLSVRGRWRPVTIPGESGQVSVETLRSPLDDLRPAQEATRVPAVGEHTWAILAELGHSDDDIRDLAARGVIGSRGWSS